jgi:hydrogenase large subunit
VSRVVVDPVSRVNGHLRVEFTVASGAVAEAWVAGTAYRGLEGTLVGRSARDAWLMAQRTCGSCVGVHGLASVRAIEDAIGLTAPHNARLLRNLISASVLLEHDVMAFYLRQLPDWADASSALLADPAATAGLAQTLSDWPNSSPAHFEAARGQLTALASAGQLASGAWGHPAYRLPPELNLLLYAHYLEALDWQRQLVQLRTILTGKSPHPQTYLVGGMASAAQWGGPARVGEGEHPWGAALHPPAPLSAAGLANFGDLLTLITPFIGQVFQPDTQALAAWYPAWELVGRGIGHYLSFGEFPRDETGQLSSLLIARGRVMDRNLNQFRLIDEGYVAEATVHSWYDAGGGAQALVKPAADDARPAYSGPKPPYDSLEGYDRYSWVKAPRYDDDPFEVGPLARMIVAFAGGSTDARIGLDAVARQLNTGMDGIFSTIGRVVVPPIEAQLLAERMREWLRELVANMGSGDLALVDLNAWDDDYWPAAADGVGLAEGPGGPIGHWLAISAGRISHYQIVAGGTWNASPRDQRGRPGALEQALVGTPIADAGRPLEVLRTVHSFDPCLACAVQ